MSDVILIFHKVEKTTTEDGIEKSFDKYFGYHQQKTIVDGVESLIDDVNPVTGKRCKAIKIRFANSFKEKHPLADMQFPCFVEVDMEKRILASNKDGELKEVNMCYIKPDTDKDGNVRRTKEGKRVPICVIHDALSIKEAPRRVIGWDDIDDFE